MLIITSKTKAKHARQSSRTYSVPQQSVQAENVRKFGKTTYDGDAKKQYQGVAKSNREEFRNEKRMLELHDKGYNEAAIAGMMFGEKNSTTNEAKVKKVIRTKKSLIKRDGNV